MNDAVTLFDNGSTLCTLSARAPEAARLVVTFNCSNSNDVSDLGWGEEFLWNEGFDVLSVKARTNQWYQDLSLGDLAQVMAGLAYEEVFTYGTSMGAYAAAYFAGAVSAKRAVLFSPQYSIDPTFAAWDERWKAHWSIPFTHVPLAQAASPTTEYVIFYDPWGLDGRHVGEIAAAVGDQNVLNIKVPLSSHDTTTTIFETGLLATIVLALLRSSPDVPGIVKDLSRRNKETWTYAYHLFFRALNQRRRVANKAFALEISRRARRLSHRILSLEPLFAVKAWDEAADVMTGLGVINPGEDIWVDGAVASIDDAMRKLEDREARDRLVPLWRQATGERAPFVTAPIFDPSAVGDVVAYMSEDATPMNGSKLIRELGGMAKARAMSLKGWANARLRRSK